MLIEILIVIALTLLNGVFSGAEIAILSLRKTRIQELVEARSVGARAVSDLRADPEGFLATVQIGITVIGATAAAFGGASIASDLAPLIGAVPGLARFAEDIALVFVVVIVSTLSVVLGELVPKSLALRSGERYALLIAKPLATVAWFTRPVVRVLSGASNLVLRIFGDQMSFTEARLSKDEIQQIVEQAATAGSFDRGAGEIASRALDFSGLDAYTVMVRRADAVMIPKDTDVATLANLALEKRHARVPVYEGSPDNVVGFVNVRDVLAHATNDPSTRIDTHIHKTVYVLETMTAPAVLRHLQEAHTHLALVINEQGTTVGLITIEDLIEELVGEILSENDPTPTGILSDADGSWIVSGTMPLHELERALDLKLPEGDFATLAGLCLQLAGRIPSPGDVLETDHLQLEILDAGQRRVRKVRIRRIDT